MNDAVTREGPVRVGLGSRLRTALLVALVLACLLPAAAPASAREPSPAGDVACVDGLRDVTDVLDRGRIAALARLPDGRVLGVGQHNPNSDNVGSLRVLTATREHGRWSFDLTLGPNGSRAGLQALAISVDGTPWAAGIRYDSAQDEWPLIVRRVAGAWRDATPTTLRGFATAIATDAAGRVWATTVENGATGPVARVYGRRGGGWARASLPSIAGVERYVAVVAPTSERTFVAGSTVTSTGLRPVILARSGDTWRRERVETGGDHVVLTGLAARADAPLQAAGWALAPGRVRPLVLRRGPDAVWRPLALTGATGVAGIVMDLATGAEGGVAVGGSYLSSAGQWVPAVAHPAAEPAWLVAARPGWFVQAAAGDPSTSGWAALALTRKGGAGSASMIARTCDLAPVDDVALRQQLRAQRRAVLQHAKARARRLAERAERVSAAERRRHPHRAAPAGPITGDLVLTDIAADLGLPTSSASYGVDAADLDGDGRRDLVWSRHGGPLAVYLRTDDGFSAYLGTGFAPADRHTCVAARLDGDGRADIACVTGGMSGLGITSNELYLDPTGGDTLDTGTEHGLTDPIARGRRIVSLDADGDGDLDLYLTGRDRPDGLPSVNRLLLNDGAAQFTWASASGLTASFAAGAVEAADLDRDGQADLVVSHVADAPGGARIHLYRNLGGGRFRDVAAEVGLATIGESDVALAQLDGRGALDIVQIASGRLVVRLWQGTRYRVALDRPVAYGHGVEAGDVDGDGDMDLYLLLGKGRHGVLDVILRNDGTGRGWTEVPVPGTLEGGPGNALAIDLDDDGRDEFVVVSNGPFRVIDAS